MLNGYQEDHEPVHSLSEKDINTIKKQFLKITFQQSIMTKKHFSDSMGILNIQQASFLIDSIFQLIDVENKLQVSQFIFETLNCKTEFGKDVLAMNRLIRDLLF